VRSNEIVAARRIRLSEQSGHAINQCRRPSHILAYASVWTSQRWYTCRLSACW